MHVWHTDGLELPEHKVHNLSKVRKEVVPVAGVSWDWGLITLSCSGGTPLSRSSAVTFSLWRELWLYLVESDCRRERKEVSNLGENQEKTELEQWSQQVKWTEKRYSRSKTRNN
jgi:hypothetical protein